MSIVIISFEQFLKAVDSSNKPFVEELHGYLLDNGCLGTFEERKSGFLASYKYGKPQRALLNFLFGKNGMLTRIYGERVSSYSDFLSTLSPEMIAYIENASICKRLVYDTCSPKCMGYDFTIGSDRFQKCRYTCFRFLITDESKPYIKSFVEHELKERAVVGSD